MDGSFGTPGLARERRLRALAAGSLALVLIVVVASAAIRHSGGELGAWLPLVRGAHRVSASLATLLIAILGWFAWRTGRRALALAIVGVTAGLSILGAATGIAPPPAAQAGNLLGGLLLAALLSRLLSRRAAPSVSFAQLLLALAAVQALIGTWIAVFADELWSWPLVLHALLGIGLALGTAWFALRWDVAALRLGLVLLALVTPAAGAAAALFDLPLAATLAHATAAALLICAIACAQPRAA